MMCLIYQNGRLQMITITFNEYFPYLFIARQLFCTLPNTWNLVILLLHSIATYYKKVMFKTKVQNEEISKMRFMESSISKIQ